MREFINVEKTPTIHDFIVIILSQLHVFELAFKIIYFMAVLTIRFS